MFIVYAAGILKGLSMQVLCFCRFSYSYFFFWSKPKCVLSDPGLKSLFLLLNISGWVINLSSSIIMFSHKCFQIFCAIPFYFLSTFCSPLLSWLHYRLCTFVFWFQLSLQLGLFHSYSLRCWNVTVQFITKKLFHCQHVH